ncbi:MAG: hypothetical protein KME09_04600 [Pleurocapsa minor HA4230-MV1]|nr:hypothetical protein [Pleurocapsa minor HA4230-MV1]
MIKLLPAFNIAKKSHPYLTKFMDVNNAQIYALLYCQYDSASGSRRYDLLSPKIIKELDLAVAKAAQSSPKAEITKIIYFGSPHAQRLTNPSQRHEYASSIVRRLEI